MAEKLAHDLEWIADRSVSPLPAHPVGDRRGASSAMGGGLVLDVEAGVLEVRSRWTRWMTSSLMTPGGEGPRSAPFGVQQLPAETLIGQ